MLCKDAEELIKQYRIGSISADNFLLLIQHTKDCHRCQSLFTQAEAYIDKGGASDGFFVGLQKFYISFSKLMKIKQQKKKIYTYRIFYLILFILLIALAGFGIYKSTTLNQWYMYLSGFMIISGISTFFMLFSVD